MGVMTMNEWVVFITKLVAIAFLLCVEDYILWRLWLLKTSQPRKKTIIPPRDNPPLNGKGYEATNGKSNQQAINKQMAREELDSRGDKPNDKNKNKDSANYEYVFLCGFRHIPHLIKFYFTKGEIVGNGIISEEKK